jgi:hypothetical protein
MGNRNGSNAGRWAKIASLLLVATVLGAAFALSQSGDAGPRVPELMQQIFSAQEEIPEEEVAVLQSLRVVAAVEMVYFTEKGGYASPEELQAAGYLDPQWPRVDASAYTISCEIGEESSGFTCFADPHSPYTNYYYVSPSQSVRYERARRPDESSPVFGMSKENL